jgi:hypothetical protein
MKHKSGKTLLIVLTLVFLFCSGVSLFFFFKINNHVVVACPLNKPVSQASALGKPVVLPFVVILDSVDVMFHPNILVAVNPKTGRIRKTKPRFMTIGPDIKSGQLSGYSVCVHNYISFGKKIAVNDTITYIHYPYLGGVPAVRITITEPQSGNKATGWVSYSNFMNPVKTLPVNDDMVVLFPRRKIQDISSQITLHFAEKEQYNGSIDYKHSFRMKRWIISQVHLGEWDDSWEAYTEYKVTDLFWLRIFYLFFGLSLMLSLFIIKKGR